MLDWIPRFAVSSGPCVVSDNERCVGRPGGYLPNEECTIAVGGGGGLLGSCSVFDLEYPLQGCGGICDYLTMPDGTTHDGSDCPVGTTLAPDDSVGWTSNAGTQGTVGDGSSDNDCAAKGTCGAPWSASGLGGGWELCFA